MHAHQGTLQENVPLGPQLGPLCPGCALPSTFISGGQIDHQPQDTVQGRDPAPVRGCLTSRETSLCASRALEGRPERQSSVEPRSEPRLWTDPTTPTHPLHLHPLYSIPHHMVSNTTSLKTSTHALPLEASPVPGGHSSNRQSELRTTGSVYGCQTLNHQRRA